MADLAAGTRPPRLEVGEGKSEVLIILTVIPATSIRLDKQHECQNQSQQMVDHSSHLFDPPNAALQRPGTTAVAAVDERGR
jgi:hypothetical protein